MKHWAPYIFVFFSMLGMSSLSYSQIPTVEREALVALYNSTNGANWTNNSGWLGSAGTECAWYGIDCSGGKVSSILLWNNNLSGTIPSELCNLSTNVYRLILNNELGSGSLSGSIPSCLSGLTGLDQLYLQDNQLSGTIPQSILDLGIANFFTYNNNLDNVPATASITGGNRTVADSNGSAGESVTVVGTIYDHELRGQNSRPITTEWLVNGSVVSTQPGGNYTNYNIGLSLSDGSNTVALRVTDYHGAVTTATVTITVQAAAVNVSPTVSISGGNRTIADSDGSAGETVSFTGTASDSDGTIASTQWLVGGSEVATGTSASISLGNGTTVVTFKATDDDGASISTTVTITVEVPNVSPSVSISGGDRTIADTDGSAGETVSFTATATDSDGTIASTHWLVGGSEVATGTSASISLSNGATVVTFKATDNDGSSTTTTATITVRENYVPTDEWPSPFNGVTPDSLLNLELNNIGAYIAAEGKIYSCLRLFTDGLQSSFNGVSQFDIKFKIISLDEGTIQITSFREFNSGYALNEKGQVPDCSGKFETSSGIYTDVIETKLPTYFLGTPIDILLTFNMSFKLIDPTNLILKLDDYKELTAN